MEKSKIEKINLNFGGVNLNGILIPEASSAETIKNLLELRSQVNYFIDLLESMRPEKEKVYTDVIPIPPETKSLAQRAQEFQQEKEKKSATIKGSFEIKDKKKEEKEEQKEEKKQPKENKGKNFLKSLKSFLNNMVTDDE